MPAKSGSDVALVRLNISDLDPDKPLLADEHLETLLAHYDGSTNRASARALRIIAASEVLLSKVIRTQDLSTDGAKVAEKLVLLAQVYDAEADAEEAETEGALHIVPFGSSRVPREAEEWRF